MGLFDKATGGLSNRFQRGGEETVRKVDYDALDNLEPETPLAPPPPVPVAPSVPKPKHSLSSLLPKVKRTTVPEDLEFDDELPETAPSSAFDVPPEPAFGGGDTAFALDESEPSFYELQQQKWDQVQAEHQDPLEVAAPQEKKKHWFKGSGASDDDLGIQDTAKIKDVLEVLRIPSTFEIPEDVLMVQDFSGVDFDVQVPKGYDFGQVEAFVEKSEASIREYLKLLELRNEHIARLATTIDRLQVDLQNLKYDNQLNAGIGIIPTSDNDELEKENMELRLQIKKLQEQLKSKETAPDLTSKEREVYEAMRDQYSVLEREKEDLLQQVFDLKTQIGKMEDEADDPEWMAGTQMPQAQEETAFENLPGIDLMGATLPPPPVTPPPAVLPPPAELPTPTSTLPTPPAPRIYDEDDEDELDQLMKDWNN